MDRYEAKLQNMTDEELIAEVRNLQSYATYNSGQAAVALGVLLSRFEALVNEVEDLGDRLNQLK